MSFPLFKQEMKATFKTLLIFISVIAMYSIIITIMFDPAIGKIMNEMMESMPELFAAFGMKNPGSTLLGFLNNYLYGFILVLIPFIFSLILTYKLIAKYIDNGSMAYLLNTHHSRQSIIMTQLVVAFVNLLIVLGFNFGLVLVTSMFIFPHSLDISNFVIVNIGLLGLQLFLLAVCFACACFFNELKYSVGLAGGIGIGAILIQMLSQINDNTSFMKNFTPLTLFNAGALTAHESSAFIGIALLYVLGIGLIALGIDRFTKRDLPL